MQQETTLLEKIANIPPVANVPPIAAAGFTILGFSLTDWVAIVTIFYTCLLIASWFFRMGRRLYAWYVARNGGMPMALEDDTDKAPL